MSAGGIAAPFVDAAGVALLAGGGTRLLGGGFGWAAGGGQSVLRSARPSTSDAPAAVLLVLHAYDGVTGDPWVQVRPTATPLTPPLSVAHNRHTLLPPLPLSIPRRSWSFSGQPLTRRGPQSRRSPGRGSCRGRGQQRQCHDWPLHRRTPTTSPGPSRRPTG